MAYSWVLRSLPVVTSALLAADGVCLPFDANCCHINPLHDPSYAQFEGNPLHEVPGWEVVDLDLPAAQRWQQAVRPAAEAIRTMIQHFKGFVGLVSQDLFKLIEDAESFKRIGESVLQAMGDYGLEIRGIANATGIPLQDLLFYNIMYEIEGGCTSIIAQDPQGKLVHGRNLDFGLLFGIDWKKRPDWRLTEDLRPLLRNVRFVRGGQVLFQSTVFLGYVGLLTGVKEGAFSITVNTRFDNDHWSGLIAYLTGRDRRGRFLSFTTRDVMLQSSSYDEALATIKSAKLLGPAYVILAGTQPGQGAVVARSSTEVVNQTLLSDVAQLGQNSVVQTNWDVDSDPWYDNRRAPAEHCLRERFNQAIDFKGLFSVLVAHPNRNLLTTYTALMSAQTGELEAYLQFCPEPNCAPWATEANTLTTAVLI
mmetsp:Transcript_32637/g.52513  ORF Transcript_32637/g.52513 Transcript_32637/m.52513 type:complete len:422 (-) Transcript_32637:186-1451(-)